MRNNLATIVCAAVLMAGGTGTASALENKITHGPILGRPSAHGMGVWVRTSQTGKFSVRYGLSPDAMNQTAVGSTDLSDDNTGWVELKNLEASTKYYYDVWALNADQEQLPNPPDPSPHGGSFRTLPDSRDYVDAELNPEGLFNFRFEFGCGNNQNLDHGSGPALPAFATMYRELKDNIDFAILNGDWMYEQQRDFPPGLWAAQVGVRREEIPEVVRVMPTIVGVWENYKVFLDDGRNLRRWHRNVPSYFTFDDHEMLNDVWGAGTPGLRDRRAVFRDIGIQAWYDYLGWSNPTKFTQPIYFGRCELKAGSDVLVDPMANFSKLDLEQAGTLHVHWGTPTAAVNDNALDGVGGDPNAGVYEIVKVLDDQRVQIKPAAKANGQASYSIGRRSYYKFRVANCEFFALDTRSHREMHDTSRPAQPGLSMIGLQQREWLLEGMRNSDADFLFVVSSVNFMVPHVGGGAVRADNKDDAWTVFLDEREKLIDTWNGLGKPVFVLTGDLHNSFAIKITDRVWEFASGPHNSNNHWYTDEGDRPATGKFKYGPREVDIRWSTHFKNDIPRDQLYHPHYCVVQINNVYNNPQKVGDTRWIAFERPQVIFQYFDGRSGDLRYAESIVGAGKADSRKGKAE